MTESPSRVRSHTDVIQRHGHGVDDVRLAPDDLHRRRLGLGSHGEGQTSEGESEAAIGPGTATVTFKIKQKQRKPHQTLTAAAPELGHTMFSNSGSCSLDYRSPQ